jgi:DNA-nicking Smr family endonuclease
MGRDSDDEKENEAKLWALSMADVTPIQRDAPSSDKKPSPSSKKRKKITRPPSSIKVNAPKQEKQLDGRTLQRLEKGEMKIEATLDLHELRQDAAKQQVENFIRTSYTKNRRLVLIITGHGKRQKQNEDRAFWEQEPGVLKKRVPDWLSVPPFSEMILRILQAHRKHGGEGAYYVYLAKNKN